MAMRHPLLLALSLSCLVGCPAGTPMALYMGPNAMPMNFAMPGTGNLRALTTSLVLKVGDTLDLATHVRHADSSLVTTPVLWTSNSDAVASVKVNTGVVTGRSVGRTILTGRLANNLDSVVALEVNVVEQHTVALIKVEPATPKLEVGQMLKLSAQVILADGQINGNVAWASSDSTIAVVNPTTGTLSALREGKVTILATYSADLRYKGLAEVEIVKALPTTPLPTTAPIVFGPSATPIPAVVTPPPPALTPAPVRTPSPAPASGGSASGEDEVGVTAPSAATFRAPGFVMVRDFSSYAVFSLVDFNQVVVADGTTLTVTRNAGRSWTVFKNVGTQAIRSMHWFSASEGWVGGDNGTLLKVSIQDGVLTTQVHDSGTTQPVNSIYFASKQVGWFKASYYSVVNKQTLDGGVTWEPVPGNGNSWYDDGFGGAVQAAYNRPGYNGHHEAFRSFDGIVTKVVSDDASKFSNVRVVPGAAFLNSESGWLCTKDWKTFTPISSNLQTPSQILRKQLYDIYPISPTTLLARVDGGYALSRDGGALWSDPVKDLNSFSSVKPVSETQMWAHTDYGELYRAGTP
jgi:hypothetical protein